jgi:hypothetical protein
VDQLVAAVDGDAVRSLVDHDSQRARLDLDSSAEAGHAHLDLTEVLVGYSVRVVRGVIGYGLKRTRNIDAESIAKTGPGPDCMLKANRYDLAGPALAGLQQLTEEPHSSKTITFRLPECR